MSFSRHPGAIGLQLASRATGGVKITSRAFGRGRRYPITNRFRYPD